MDYVAALDLIPFIGWGIYTLHRRYRYHEEPSLLLQIITLACLVLFFATEVWLLRPVLHNNTVLFLFTVLGLLVATVALYGHIFIALASQLIVDMLVPGDDPAPDRPRLGPAEALERQRDYEGALEEYLVLARIFPHDPVVHSRIAEDLLRLSRPGESVAWFKRALRYTASAEHNLSLATRLCEVYEQFLGEPDGGVETLQAFLRSYPDTPEAETVRARLQQLGKESVSAVSPQLQALTDEPLGGTPAASPENQRAPAPALKPMDKTPPKLSLEPMDKAPPKLSLEPMDRTHASPALEPMEPHAAPETPPPAALSPVHELALEPMEAPLPSEPTQAESLEVDPDIAPGKTTKRIELEPMDRTPLEED